MHVEAMVILTGVVVLYALGAYAERRDALVGLGLVALAIGIREYYGFPRTELDNWNAAVFYVLLLLAFVGGIYVRSRRASCHRALSSPPTGSSRRRSRTCASTPVGR